MVLIWIYGHRCVAFFFVFVLLLLLLLSPRHRPRGFPQKKEHVGGLFGDVSSGDSPRPLQVVEGKGMMAKGGLFSEPIFGNANGNGNRNGEDTAAAETDEAKR